MSTVTNLLEDGEQVAAHMLLSGTAVGPALSALAVHVEQIAKAVGYAVEGELPKLEKELLGYQPPEETAEQKLIKELQAKVDALSGAQPSPEQVRIKELELELQKGEQAQGANVASAAGQQAAPGAGGEQAAPAAGAEQEKPVE